MLTRWPPFFRGPTRGGLDYTVMNVCSARFPRGLHAITFNREDPDERARADTCYRKMSQEVGARGVFVGGAPVDYHTFHIKEKIGLIVAELTWTLGRYRAVGIPTHRRCNRTCDLVSCGPLADRWQDVRIAPLSALANGQAAPQYQRR
jgi:hypothetical protein